MRLSHVPCLGPHVTVIWVAPTFFQLEQLPPPSPTPMVSTRKTRKSRKPAEESFAPADSGDECEERIPEPGKARGTKRAKTAKTTVKGKQKEKHRKKAKLSMLPEMPIDVLYEVRGSFERCVC